MSEDAVVKAATGVAVGTAAGVAAGLANAATAPHAMVRGAGVANAASKFSHGTTVALRHHKSLGAALGAGATAVIGHGALATVAVAAAPVVLATAAVGGVFFGAYKLVKFFTED
jgi:hypothetical protein